jgi:subtilisin family serine protease
VNRRSNFHKIQIQLQLAFALLLLLLFGCKSPGEDISTQAEDGWQSSAVKNDNTIETDGQSESEVHDQADLAAGIPLAGSRDLPPEAYAPHSITLFFRQGITLAELQAGRIAIVPGAASAAPNALLRQDPACEFLADDIASHFGIELTNQVYLGRTRMAAFRLPESIDQERLLTELQTGYGNFIVDAAASQTGQPCFTPNDPDYLMSGSHGGPLWGLHAMDFKRAWDLGTGSESILIATLDSGANMQHEELLGQLVDPAIEWPEITADIVNHDNTIEDSHGHGTGMASLISAAFNNGRTVAGGAPGCRHLSIKITNNWASDFTIASLLEGGYLAGELGVDILSMSFTIFEASPAVHDMLLDLSESGMLLLAAAGNDGDQTDNYPAGFPEVISVGSSDIGDVRSSFSNGGPGVELAAPGRDLRVCGWQFNSGALAYSVEFGTSLSTPLAAAAAGLLWSAHPELDAGEIRSRLALSGRPTSGFGHGVPHVDIGALLNDFNGALLLPELPGMIVSAELQISGQVVEQPPQARLLLGSEILDELTAAPWQFSASTESRLIGAELLSLESGSELQPYLDAALVLVDNTVGVYPLLDGAEQASGLLTYFDAGQAQRSVRLALENQFAPDWTDESVQMQGQGRWQRIADDSADGTMSWYCGMVDAMEYDGSEFDCLVSSRIDLTAAVTPLLRFSQHYNVQSSEFGYDRLSVHISSDNGASWGLLSLAGGAPAWFSGYQPNWQILEIPLQDYNGEHVHICFSLQSNSELSGENSSQPAGCWLDEIYVGEVDASAVARFSLDSPAADDLFGSVPGRSSVPVQLQELQNLATVQYRLDLRPFGKNSGEDLLHGPVPGTALNLNLSSELRTNQRAWLSILSTNQSGQSGQGMLIPLYIFSKPGDANADGLVDIRDVQLIGSSVGMTQQSQGWSPFLDSDLDGFVTELDQAVVGYYWNDSQ